MSEKESREMFARLVIGGFICDILTLPCIGYAYSSVGESFSCDRIVPPKLQDDQ